MIVIKSEESQVKIIITSQYPIGDFTFPFSFQAGQEYAARLLAYNLNKTLFDCVQKARIEAYESGWSDAKKHKEKATRFSGRLTP